jgi:heat shock protein HslJ
MTKSRIAFSVFLSAIQLLGLACGIQGENVTVPSVAPSLEQVGCAKITGIYDDKPIRLKKGIYEGAPFVEGGAAHPTVELLGQLTATADLDSLPGEERVVILAESSGGSGVNVYLAVFGLRNGNVENLGTILVGNRVQSRRLDISDGTIVLDVVQAGPQEAMCCPTQLARRTYRLESCGLKQVASEVVGTLSLAAIAEIEWTLEEINGRPLAQGSRAPTFKVTNGAASGFGGCNRYKGSIKESSLREMAIVRIISTKMACPEPQMSLEDQFLADLSLVTSYSFLNGRLALGWKDGTRNGVLVFRQ